MLKTLVLKEWKDKVSLFLFAAAIQVLYVLGHAALASRADFRDLLLGTMLLVFFPFVALLLGSSAFEREFRSDAWAYLFSRPVGKSTIWAAKFLALLGLLAALWGTFLAITAATIGIRSLAKGFELPLGAGAKLSLLPLGVLASLSFFIIAFSLSFLSPRSFSILFAALIIAIGLGYGFVFAFLAGFRAYLPALTNPKVAVLAYRGGALFLSAAFAAASLMAFIKADFSQPRKKIALFASRSALCVGAAVVLLGLWMTFLPGVREKRLWNIQVSGTDVFFSTDKGIYRYDAAGDELTRLTTSKIVGYVGPESVRSGKAVLYSEYRQAKQKRWTWEVWVMSKNGSGKKRILREDQVDSDLWVPAWRGMILSPDGKQLLYSSYVDSKNAQAVGSYLWRINTDGSGNESLPLDSSAFQDLIAEASTVTPLQNQLYSLNLIAWPEGSDNILCIPSALAGRRQSKFLMYDLATRTSRLLFEATRIGFGAVASPGHNHVAFTYRRNDEDELRLAWLDLANLEVNDIWSCRTRENALFYRLVWNAEGDKLAFVRSADEENDKGYVVNVYSTGERRLQAEKRMEHSDYGTMFVDWLADGRRLVLNDRYQNGLLILGPDLEVAKKIAFPDSRQSPLGAYVAADKILVIDAAADDLWRFDLETERWKKIY